MGAWAYIVLTLVCLTWRYSNAQSVTPSPAPPSTPEPSRAITGNITLNEPLSENITNEEIEMTFFDHLSNATDDIVKVTVTGRSGNDIQLEIEYRDNTATRINVANALAALQKGTVVDILGTGVLVNLTNIEGREVSFAGDVDAFKCEILQIDLQDGCEVCVIEDGNPICKETEAADDGGVDAAVVAPAIAAAIAAALLAACCAIYAARRRRKQEDDDSSDEGTPGSMPRYRIPTAFHGRFNYGGLLSTPGDG